MKLQQLRCLTEVARRGLNVSEAAEALHTSQPGVSKQIKALEDELGIQVFVRHGKRLVAVTEPGKAVVAIAERILSEAQNLRRAGEEFANDKLGTLTIAATHTQARYALPNAVTAFKRRYPNVKLVIHQGNPTQICEQVLAGEADFCTATAMIAPSTRATCSSRAPRAWGSSAAPACAATPTSSSSCSPPTCRATSSSRRSWGKKARATSFENRGQSPISDGVQKMRHRRNSAISTCALQSLRSTASSARPAALLG